MLYSNFLVGAFFGIVRVAVLIVGSILTGKIDPKNYHQLLSNALNYYTLPDFDASKVVEALHDLVDNKKIFPNLDGFHRSEKNL